MHIDNSFSIYLRPFLWRKKNNSIVNLKCAFKKWKLFKHDTITNWVTFRSYNHSQHFLFACIFHAWWIVVIMVEFRLPWMWTFSTCICYGEVSIRFCVSFYSIRFDWIDWLQLVTYRIWWAMCAFQKEMLLATQIMLMHHHQNPLSKMMQWHRVSCVYEQGIYVCTLHTVYTYGISIKCIKMHLRCVSLFCGLKKKKWIW